MAAWRIERTRGRMVSAEARSNRTGAPSARSTRRTRSAVAIALAQIAILVGILALWQLAVSDEALPYFSRPTLVAAKLVELLSGDAIYRHIAVTLTEIAVGYSLGAMFGLALGFVLGRSGFLSAVLQPYIMGLYSIPKIALAPVFIVWLGLGIASKIAVVFLASFFLVFFNTYSGLLSLNEELVRLARLMGASWPQAAVRVILPASAHQIFLGLKTAVPYAVIGAVIGEYIGSNEGLGYFILYASQTYDAPALFSGIIILVAIVFLANFVLNAIEAKVIRWRKAGSQTVQL
jgi:NitT/TauT family transport system permease protein